MERIEEMMSKRQGLKLYEKLDHIPVRDHLYKNYDKEFTKYFF